MNHIFAERKTKVKDFQDVVRSRLVEEKEIEIPDGLYEKCRKCNGYVLKEELTTTQFVCVDCGHHFRMTARERIQLLVDAGSFEEVGIELTGTDPLKMPGYADKLASLYAKGLTEAVVTGIGQISGFTYAIAVMDSYFLMGSMGTVVGEKIVQLTQYATVNKMPLIIFSASGGARMQEGILSLMQMAKTTAAIKKHSDAGLLYISVLTDPTFGGVSASFATVADIIIAEPGALIGFAGPRVIKQTIKQVVPEGFQSAEFLLERGLIDMIVSRPKLVETIARISKMYASEVRSHGFKRDRNSN
jgi:acetyl-CoA carboxylase carboxyl transferase subunit beta